MFSSITFKLPAEDLASLALSSAILLKNTNEKYTRTKDTCVLPNSIPRLDFKLQASNRLKKKPKFLSLVHKVEDKVTNFQIFFKEAILDIQQMEITKCRNQLQKTMIHYLLLLSNHLVRFSKRLYSRTTFADKHRCADKSILSKDAVCVISLES